MDDISKLKSEILKLSGNVILGFIQLVTDFLRNWRSPDGEPIIDNYNATANTSASRYFDFTVGADLNTLRISAHHVNCRWFGKHHPSSLKRFSFTLPSPNDDSVYKPYNDIVVVEYVYRMTQPADLERLCRIFDDIVATVLTGENPDTAQANEINPRTDREPASRGEGENDNTSSGPVGSLRGWDYEAHTRREDDFKHAEAFVRGMLNRAMLNEKTLLPEMIDSEHKGMISYYHWTRMLPLPSGNDWELGLQVLLALANERWERHKSRGAKRQPLSEKELDALLALLDGTISSYNERSHRAIGTVDASLVELVGHVYEQMRRYVWSMCKRKADETCNWEYFGNLSQLVGLWFSRKLLKGDTDMARLVEEYTHCAYYRTDRLFYAGRLWDIDCWQKVLACNAKEELQDARKG